MMTAAMGARAGIGRIGILQIQGVLQEITDLPRRAGTRLEARFPGTAFFCGFCHWQRKSHGQTQ